MESKKFLKFTAICGFLSVITTLGIHLVFADVPTDFEERAAVFQNGTYILNHWWIIIHCLLVLVAMWGFFLTQFRKSLGFSGMGFLFFVVFAVVEIIRQMFVLFYLNGLRAKYLAEPDMAVKALYKYDLTTFSMFSNSFFGMFILAFGLANLFYGLSLYKDKGFGKILSWMLIIWALFNFMALANEFMAYEPISNFLGIYNYTYQPFIRGLMAWWVWKKAIS
jgi:hypothetical protein